jgi:TonB family protein
MRNSWKLLIIAIALTIVQSCGKKSNENTEEYVATEVPVVSAKFTTEERRAKIAKDKAERAKRRRLEFEERVKSGPTYKDADGKIIYHRSEVQPMFNGGEEAMTKYLNENLMYPESAKKDEIEGTVFVDFVVGEDGNVRNVVTTDDGVDQSLRMEAIRVVSNMPRWVPGKRGGKSVPVYYNVPVTFVLQY